MQSHVLLGLSQGLGGVQALRAADSLTPPPKLFQLPPVASVGIRVLLSPGQAGSPLLGQCHLQWQGEGALPEGGEPGEPGVGLSAAKPSSRCRARGRTTLGPRSRFSLAARSLLMLSFRSSGSSKECMVMGGGRQLVSGQEPGGAQKL